jgi:hypothetical protein
LRPIARPAVGGAENGSLIDSVVLTCSRETRLLLLVKDLGDSNALALLFSLSSPILFSYELGWFMPELAVTGGKMLLSFATVWFLNEAYDVNLRLSPMLFVDF